MNEIIGLIQKSYKLFYLGNDEKAWLHFSQLIEKIEKKLLNKENDRDLNVFLVEFIGKFELIELYKNQQNITLLADLLLDIEYKLIRFKELN